MCSLPLLQNRELVFIFSFTIPWRTQKHRPEQHKLHLHFIKIQWSMSAVISFPSKGCFCFLAVWHLTLICTRENRKIRKLGHISMDGHEQNHEEKFLTNFAVYDSQTSIHDKSNIMYSSWWFMGRPGGRGLKGLWVPLNPFFLFPAKTAVPSYGACGATSHEPVCAHPYTFLPFQ